MRRYARTLVVIAVLVTIASLVLGFQTFNIGGFERGSDSVLGLSLGLDLQGGSDLRYRAIDPVTGEPYTPEARLMQALQRGIEERINSSGLGRPNIQILGEDRLLIQLPGVQDLERAKDLIGETAQLVYRERKLNVATPLTEITSEDIISVSVTPLGDQFGVEATSTEAGLGLIEGQVTSTAATATATGMVSATSTVETATTTDSTATSTPARLGDLPEIPVLTIEFSEEAAEVFAAVVDRMRLSLAPVPGTEERVPGTGELIPGTGDVYVNVLEILAGPSTSSPLLLTYAPAITLPGEGLVPLGGEPFIKRVGDTSRFSINLLVALIDMEEAVSRFEAEPDIRFTEVLGRLDEDIGLTGDDMSRAYAGTNQNTGLPIVNIEFNTEGARKFGEVTTRLFGKPDLLVIELDGKELIASSVRSPITGGVGFIEGPDFTLERVRDIALLLESGRLPIPIELIQERDVDAILGADSLAKSVVAGLVGLALVLLFMALYYRVAGLVAAVALVIYAMLVLAIFKILGVTLELSGVAAAILSIGMAVDANILIFERMKEELRAGRTLLSSINIGFNRAWPAIRDSNVSTLITCGILFWFADTLGATIVQSFAATLAIGVATSMFSAITVSRTFLRLMAATALNKRLGWFVPSGGSDLPQLRPRSEAV